MAHAGRPDRVRRATALGTPRIGVLVLGVAMLAAPADVHRSRSLRLAARALAAHVLRSRSLAITAPALAIDLARYGPQEPLLVGVHEPRSRAARPDRRPASRRRYDPREHARYNRDGLAVWWLGVLQKETSLCALVLIPFLTPTALSERRRWAVVGSGRRTALRALTIGVLLPFVPMLARTLQLTFADDRVYEEAAAGRSLLERLIDQIDKAGATLHSPVFTVVAVGAIVSVSIAALVRGVDWVGVGMVVTAAAFVVFAAGSGVVASRYYLPPLTLLAVAGARALATFRAEVIVAVSAVVIWSRALATPRRTRMGRGGSTWSASRSRWFARLQRGPRGAAPSR